MLGLARLDPRVYLSKETERQADSGCTHSPDTTMYRSQGRKPDPSHNNHNNIGAGYTYSIQGEGFRCVGNQVDYHELIYRPTTTSKYS